MKKERNIKLKFSIKIKTNGNPNWRIELSDVTGRIKKIDDRQKLIKKIIDEIKINQDEQGCFDIGDLILDLTTNQKI